MTGDQIKALRKNLGFTQIQMATALGYTRQAQISDLENGRATLDKGRAILADRIQRGYDLEKEIALLVGKVDDLTERIDASLK